MKDKEARELIGQILDILETYNGLHNAHNKADEIIDNFIGMLHRRIMDIEKRLSCTQNNQN